MFARHTLSALALLVCSAPAHATLVQAFDFEALSGFADAIVRGRVVDIESSWEGRLIMTEVVVEVSECIKGDCERTLTVAVVGGAVGDLVAHAEGVARYTLGEDVVLFLESTVSGRRMRTIGMAQGKFAVDGAVAVREPVPVAGRHTQAARRLDRVSTAALLARLRTAHPTP
jgi:hypothetical protein